MCSCRCTQLLIVCAMQGLLIRWLNMAEIELARGDARDVQHYFQQFSAAACGTLWCLNQQTVASSEVPGHAAPPAWLQAEDIIISQNPLTHENRESGVYSLVPTAANVSVHVLEGSGKKLSTGLLQMAPSSCIMLGPDCHDAKFEGLQLKGVYLLGSAEVRICSQGIHCLSSNPICRTL